MARHCTQARTPTPGWISCSCMSSFRPPPRSLGARCFFCFLVGAPLALLASGSAPRLGATLLLSMLAFTVLMSTLGPSLLCVASATLRGGGAGRVEFGRRRRRQKRAQSKLWLGAAYAVGLVLSKPGRVTKRTLQKRKKKHRVGNAGMARAQSKLRPGYTQTLDATAAIHAHPHHTTRDGGRRRSKHALLGAFGAQVAPDGLGRGEPAYVIVLPQLVHAVTLLLPLRAALLKDPVVSPLSQASQRPPLHTRSRPPVWWRISVT